MMVDQEIRARALEIAATLAPPEKWRQTKVIVEQANLFAIYIRLGMQGVEGMLEEPPK